MNELPNSTDTERLTLGSVFLDDAAFPQIAELPPSVYYQSDHREVFIAMQGLSTRNESISPITVFEEVRQLNPNTHLTASEIAKWSVGLPFYSNLDTYVRILKDKALKRSVIRKCGDIAAKASDESDSAANIAAVAAVAFQDMHADSMDKQRPTVTLAEGLRSNYDRWERMLRKEIVTIETGLPNIDNRLTGGGLEKGMFHVIGARPGKGKTSLGLDIASHNIFNGKTVAFFTLELSRDVLLDRFVAPHAGIERWKLTSKWMNDDDFRKLVAVGEFIKDAPLWVNHKARSAKDVRLALKNIAKNMGGEVDLIIVDFLTKMTGSKGSKYESVSYNANCLAEFASEFNAAVICLAQLSREITKRDGDGSKPKLSDFRDSGEIEELGRTIFGLWGSDETNGLRDVQISCLKQGEGMVFDESLVFDTNMMTFGTRKPVVMA